MNIMLVYQAGIANVFRVKRLSNMASRGKTERLFQGGFRDARFFCEGMAECGAVVRTAWCNQAGDIINAEWTSDRSSQPFSESTVEVNRN